MRGSTFLPGSRARPGAARLPVLLLVSVLAAACAGVAAPVPESARAGAPLPAAPSERLAAIREAEVAARMHPSDVARRRHAAALLQAAGAFDRAAVHLEAATALAPRDADLWRALAELEIARGRTDAAYMAARRAAELAPEDRTLLALLAWCAEAAGLDDEARRARTQLAGERTWTAPPPAAMEDR